MKKKYILFFVLLLSSIACNEKKTDTQKPNSEQVKALYLQQINELYQATNLLKENVTMDKSETTIQQTFDKARAAYKQVEFLAEVYNPTTVKKINGAALEEVEDDAPSVIISPEGFQVIEELVFPSYNIKNKADLLQEIGIVAVNIKHLELSIEPITLTDNHIFDAIRLQIFRLITLGISGFDSPIAFHSLQETSYSLKALQKYTAIYLPSIKTTNQVLAEENKQLFENTIQYLTIHQDFNTFNRLEFITDFANPLSANLLEVQQALKIPVFDELRALQATAKTLFQDSIFTTLYYAPSYSKDFYAKGDFKQTAELGEALFYDPILSGNNRRSCSFCHQSERGFADNLPKSLNFEGNGFIKRNSPTLFNAGLQSALFSDVKVSYLEDQLSAVLANKEEMNSSLEEVVAKLNDNVIYKKGFQKVFKTPDNQAITSEQFKIAVATYIRSLVSFRSRFDKYMQGDKTQLASLEIQGFNLFMGKALCGTCHFMPLFNGVVPPTFEDTETEVLGVPTKPATQYAQLDKDKGKGAITNIALHNFAFKTPSLRNIELTAPYMHNGAYKTLEEVIDFYNGGGGSGIGIDLPNQTLAANKLNLTDDEQKALVAFLKTLTDKSFVKSGVE